MLRVTVSWLCLTVMYLTVDMFRRTELTSGRVSLMSTARGAFMTPGEVMNVLQVSKKYFSFFVYPKLEVRQAKALQFTARTGHTPVRLPGQCLLQDCESSRDFHNIRRTVALLL